MQSPTVSLTTTTGALDRARAAAARVRALARRAGRWQPLTSLGAVVLLGGLFAVWGIGLARIDLIVLIVAGAGVLLVLLSLLACGLGAWRVRAALRAQAQTGAQQVHGEVGWPVRTGFWLPALRWLPMATVRWNWEAPAATVRPAKDGDRLLEDVVPTRRGLATRITRDIQVEDPFGFVRIRLGHTSGATVRFVPHTGALRDVTLVRGLAGGDALSHPDGDPQGDRIDMRPYAPGDPMRMVLWKVYARTRNLVVRTPERAFSPQDQTVAFVVAGAGDEPAAAAARVAVESGSLGQDWMLGADGTAEPARIAQAALDLIARSGGADPTASGAGLGPFLGDATKRGASRALVFVPARRGPWLQRVVQAASSSDRPLDVIVCVDGLVGRDLPAWRRWVMDPEAIAAQAGKTSPAELREVLRALAPTRASVTVIDRVTGKGFGAAAVMGTLGDAGKGRVVPVRVQEAA